MCIVNDAPSISKKEIERKKGYPETSYTRESWESFDFFDRGKVGEEKIEDEDWQVGQVGLVSGRRMMTGRICAMSNDIEKRIFI